MPTVLAHPLSAGRTSLRGAALALSTTPLIAFVMVPVPLFVASLIDHWREGPQTPDGLVATAGLLAYALATAFIGTFVLGAPVWLALRVARRESGLAYLLAGVAGGLIFSLRSGVSPTILFDPGMLVFCVYGGLVGGLVALASWLVARERPTLQPA